MTAVSNSKSADLSEYYWSCKLLLDDIDECGSANANFPYMTPEVCEYKNLQYKQNCSTPLSCESLADTYISCNQSIQPNQALCGNVMDSWYQSSCQKTFSIPRYLEKSQIQSSELDKKNALEQRDRAIEALCANQSQGLQSNGCSESINNARCASIQKWFQSSCKPQ